MVLVFDPAFIQAPEHRPKPAVTEAGGIPLIDLSPLHLDPDRHQEPPVGELEGLLAQVEAACRDWGFFQVVNHGVPPGVVERAWAASRGFFALPPEERRRVRRDEVNPLGYYEAENTKNVRDWKEVFDYVVHEPAVIPSLVEAGLVELRNRWPQSPPGFRINHYPPCPSPHLVLGVGRHKDSGALTILAQDEVGGLDVKRRSKGEWVRVKPIPNSYIINVGDIVQVWSNDKYESAEHRVSVNTERERFSIPFFFNPAHYVMVKPLEELIDEKNPANYKEYNWGELFKTRKNSDFKKLDVENIQVHHFKEAK